MVANIIPIMAMNSHRETAATGRAPLNDQARMCDGCRRMVANMRADLSLLLIPDLFRDLVDNGDPCVGGLRP